MPIPVFPIDPTCSNPIDLPTSPARCRRSWAQATVPGGATTVHWAGCRAGLTRAVVRVPSGPAGHDGALFEETESTIGGVTVDTTRMVELCGPTEVRWQDGFAAWRMRTGQRSAPESQLANLSWPASALEPQRLSTCAGSCCTASRSAFSNSSGRAGWHQICSPAPAGARDPELHGLGDLLDQRAAWGSDHVRTQELAVGASTRIFANRSCPRAPSRRPPRRTHSARRRTACPGCAAASRVSPTEPTWGVAEDRVGDDP